MVEKVRKNFDDEAIFSYCSTRLESIKKSDKKSRAKIYDDDEDEFEEDYEADDSYEIEQKIKSIDRNERTKNNAKKHYK